MSSTHNNYLLKNVIFEEYRALKIEESKLVAGVLEGFNEVWRPRVQDIKPSIRYHPNKKIIGIFLEKNGQKQLIQDSEGLAEAEDHVVGNVYNALEQRLVRIRLPSEKWVD